MRGEKKLNKVKIKVILADYQKDITLIFLYKQQTS